MKESKFACTLDRTGSELHEQAIKVSKVAGLRGKGARLLQGTDKARFQKVKGYCLVICMLLLFTCIKLLSSIKGFVSLLLKEREGEGK